MPIATDNFGNQFSVGITDVIGIPEPSIVYNEFDEISSLVGLSRLPEEKAVDYKRRVLDTYVDRANSTYRGLINGITRELGLSLYKPFTIKPKQLGGVYVAENPVIVFKGPYVELWRDYANGVLEMEIDRFEQTGDAYFLRDLRDFINTNSLYFDMINLDPDHEYDRSMVVVNQTSSAVVFSEGIPPATNFTLTYPAYRVGWGLQFEGAIMLETLFFNDSSVFRTRVASPLLVTSSGKYYVNAVSGNVKVFDVPAPNTSARYSYIIDLYEPIASPVIIHEIQTDNFKRKMFEQILQDDGTFLNGIPTALGADIINELLSVFPLYYGR